MDNNSSSYFFILFVYASSGSERKSLLFKRLGWVIAGVPNHIWLAFDKEKFSGKLNEVFETRNHVRLNILLSSLDECTTKAVLPAHFTALLNLCIKVRLAYSSIYGQRGIFESSSTIFIDKETVTIVDTPKHILSIVCVS